MTALSEIARVVEIEMLRRSMRHMHVTPLVGEPFVTGILTAEEACGVIPEGSAVMVCAKLHA